MKKHGMLLVFSSLVLVSCSGDKSSITGQSLESQFIDAPVKGLSFEGSSSGNGKTGNEGKFTCASGEELTFKIKNFVIGKAACGDKIFIQDLSSDDTNFTWNKAAALIQSLSKNGTAELLNLDAAQEDAAIDLSGFNFSGSIDTKVTALLSGATGYTAVTQANATNHANTSLENHIQISNALQEGLEEIVGLGSSADIYIKATLKSEIPSSADWCSKNIKAKAIITKMTNTTPAIFSMSFDKAIGYGREDEIETASDFYTCIVPSQGQSLDCEIVSSDRLPGTKVISGNRLEMLASTTYAEPSDIDMQQDITVFNRNVFSLNVTPNSDRDLDVTGSLKTYSRIVSSPSGSAYSAGDNVTCTYDISFFNYVN